MRLWSASIALLGLLTGCVTSEEAAHHDHESRGKAVYRESCMICHGIHGTGDGWVRFHPPVADLTADRIKQKSDADLLASIHEGRANTAMGSWRLVLSQEDRVDVLAYIRTLQQRR
jgi:mono/diheme cytochrome c family protein